LTLPHLAIAVEGPATVLRADLLAVDLFAEAAGGVEVGSWPPGEASHDGVSTSALPSTERPRRRAVAYQRREGEEGKGLTSPPPERNER
jgi:hypothetical protein